MTYDEFVKFWEDYAILKFHLLKRNDGIDDVIRRTISRAMAVFRAYFWGKLSYDELIEELTEDATDGSELLMIYMLNSAFFAGVHFCYYYDLRKNEEDLYENWLR